MAHQWMTRRAVRPDFTLIDHYTYTIAGDGCMQERYPKPQSDHALSFPQDRVHTPTRVARSETLWSHRSQSQRIYIKGYMAALIHSSPRTPNLKHEAFKLSGRHLPRSLRIRRPPRAGKAHRLLRTFVGSLSLGWVCGSGVFVELAFC